MTIDIPTHQTSDDKQSSKVYRDATLGLKGLALDRQATQRRVTAGLLARPPPNTSVHLRRHELFGFCLVLGFVSTNL